MCDRCRCLVETVFAGDYGISLSDPAFHILAELVHNKGTITEDVLSNSSSERDAQLQALNGSLYCLGLVRQRGETWNLTDLGACVLSVAPPSSEEPPREVVLVCGGLCRLQVCDWEDPAVLAGEIDPSQAAEMWAVQVGLDAAARPTGGLPSGGFWR